MNTPHALSRDLPHVPPPILEMADIGTRRVARQAGEKADMAATKKTVRLTEVVPRLWEIVLAVAKTTPIIAFLGYYAWQTDARKEAMQDAYISEIKSSRDMMTGVVNSATKAMEAVVKDSDETKKLITEVLTRMPPQSKRLGE